MCHKHLPDPTAKAVPATEHPHPPTSRCAGRGGGWVCLLGALPPLPSSPSDPLGWWEKTQVSGKLLKLDCPGMVSHPLVGRGWCLPHGFQPLLKHTYYRPLPPESLHAKSSLPNSTRNLNYTLKEGSAFSSHEADSCSFVKLSISLSQCLTLRDSLSVKPLSSHPLTHDHSEQG